MHSSYASDVAYLLWKKVIFIDLNESFSSYILANCRPNFKPGYQNCLTKSCNVVFAKKIQEEGTVLERNGKNMNKNGSACKY